MSILIIAIFMIIVILTVIIIDQIKIKKLQHDIKIRKIIEEKIREMNNEEQLKTFNEEQLKTFNEEQLKTFNEEQLETFNEKIIMIVDDDKYIIKIIERFLLNKYKTVSFYNPETALNFLKNKHNNINIVITDYSMPGCIDGIEFIKKIKEINNKLHIIILSGLNYIEINSKDKHLIDKYLLKPLTRERLIEVIEDIIKKGD
jgi:two-component system, cell cycle response regulator CpdR